MHKHRVRIFVNKAAFWQLTGSPQLINRLDSDEWSEESAQ